jgi:hypothetical protein
VFEEARTATLADGSPDHRTRLAAAEGLLAQVYGKPVQPTREVGAPAAISIIRPPPRD